MRLSDMASLLGPEFDDFLFAPIGEDRKGMLLSVLSALARADVDPWQEAARAIIAGLPAELATHLDPGTIAARLIALLPRRVNYDVPALGTSGGIGAVTNFRHLVRVTCIFVVLVLGALALIASRQLPAGADNADAPSFNAVIPQISR
jgi:hypothetical protein